MNLDNYLRINFLKHDPNTYSVVPESNNCNVCLTELSFCQKNIIGHLVFNIIIKCNVYIGKCTNSTCSNHLKAVSFMGTDFGMVNFGNKFFVGVELIQEYMNLYAKNGLTFNTWFNNKLLMTSYANNPVYGDVNHIKQYTGILHEAFCIGTTLFKFDKSVYYCCDIPKIVSMDGIVNSVKSCRMPKFKELWVTGSMVGRKSERSRRQLQRIKKDDPLKTLIIDAVNKKPMDFETFEVLRKSQHKGVTALSFCFEEDENGVFLLKDLAKMFGLMLVKDLAAANTLIPVNCVPIIEK